MQRGMWERFLHTSLFLKGEKWLIKVQFLVGIV